MKRWSLVIVFVSSWAAMAAAAPTIVLRGSVLGNGGTPSSGGSFNLQGTAGQPAIGLSDGAAFMVCSGFWCAGGVRVVAVDPGPAPAGAPRVFSFSPPFPNPARGRVSFALELPRASQVVLSVYDVRGRQTATIAQGRMEPGRYDITWDGSGRAEREPSGIYFAILSVDGRTLAQRRIVFLQ